MNAQCKFILGGALALYVTLLHAGDGLVASGQSTQAWFGNVHVHTKYSFDAFANGTVSTPAQAYQWAQGRSIPGSAAGPDIRIVTPLDFYAVSDHAEWMGVFKEMANPDSPLSRHPLAPRITSRNPNEAMQAFAQVLREFSAGKRDPALNDPALNASIWAEIVSTADAYYRPGEFTTFPAFEWTANPDMRNLHRVVLFATSDNVPDVVLSSMDSSDPQTLWAWMGEQRERGATLLAIPHNANASDGLMFSLQTMAGKPLDKTYIETRANNEPLYEITQIKGTSETHPALSPNDEFAGFEQWDYTLSADSKRPTHRRGSFVRQALLDGMALRDQGKGNPFQYGFIGDSDTHNAAASIEEYNYTGKFAFEVNPRHRLFGVDGQPEGQKQQVREFSSGGLAGVWAPQNTREAIYAAMQRRETFGTTGPQITVRFFGGWDFTAEDGASIDFVARGYARGVPMGGTLQRTHGDRAPAFMVWAAKDPRSGNLDRVQIIKGWIDSEGVQHERVHDVVWSDDRKVDAQGRLPPVGNTVDVGTASYTNAIGAPQLAAVWRDPAFDPAQHAFYYARVLEIPTPRWSTCDAAALGVDIPAGLPATLQERAFSSPIWYAP
ncbi:MAG: DUF3604 domain-containing protein [Halioglobus sp.]|nr:DUF3604 domain-containing protein [Halioglobus sp.]